ncbi:MAG: hypothetical protein AUH86_20035 [Acidobacteria bacterium 13_1_40CM_4_58_4]|nr:MAG: hypothetical protein AUH86_20035 [Acidobacteria bacterium 13_1_40CM_4_58_4]
MVGLRKKVGKSRQERKATAEGDGERKAECKSLTFWRDGIMSAFGIEAGSKERGTGPWQE